MLYCIASDSAKQLPGNIQSVLFQYYVVFPSDGMKGCYSQLSVLLYVVIQVISLPCSRYTHHHLIQNCNLHFPKQIIVGQNSAKIIFKL